MIRAATPGDAAGLAAVYNHYVRRTVATFDEEPLAPAAMEDRVRAAGERLPWLVCEEDGWIAGYACAGAWKERTAYRHAVECTAYVHPDATGRGIGTALYTALLERLGRLGLHRAVGVIALPNPASVALHERLGFRKAGHLSEMGRKFERWIDVGFWVRALPGADAERSR